MLTLENVSFEVPAEQGQKEILRDISLTIDDHKFVVVTGPNGGGKSTLAKLIAGIERPGSGRICFQDRDITDLGITERANLRRWGCARRIISGGRSTQAFPAES